MENRIIVSIICLTYNHERFIKKTLDGFIMQRTSFPFEVLIHDDASTDHTADIIREYEKKYPDIIKPVYQSENQYSKPGHKPIIATYLLPKAEGEYLAWCEGDDYWIDPHKLQAQVDALISNPSCVACLSKVEKITYDEVPKARYIPDCFCEDGVIEGKDFVRYALNEKGFPLQLSGFMIRRNIYDQYLEESLPFRKYFKVGDIPLALFVGLKGNVFYINKVMSYYRTGNPDSWVGRTHKTSDSSALYFLGKAKAYEAFDKYTGYEFHQEADKVAKKVRFTAYLKTHNVKEMKSKEMKELYRQLSTKKKLREHLYSTFPGLMEKRYSIKMRMKNGFFKKDNF